jgi:molybdopterin converting factor small subunit
LIIRIKLFATLGSYNPKVPAGVPFVFEMPEGSTLSDLIKHLQLPEKEVNLSFINGRIESKDYPLKSQDDVGFFPLIGGG